MTDFEVHAALTTPFRTDAWVARNALRAHIQLFVEDRVQEIVPARTTGEGTLLQESEVGSLVATAVQAGRAGRGDRPRRADLHAGDAAAGVDGRRLGGVLAYTFPARSGNELPPEVLETLAADGIARPQGLQRTSSKPCSRGTTWRPRDGAVCPTSRETTRFPFQDCRPLEKSRLQARVELARSRPMRPVAGFRAYDIRVRARTADDRAMYRSRRVRGRHGRETEAPARRADADGHWPIPTTASA
jgi:hypothetical protein